MSGYRKNTDWVMVGRNVGKSRHTLLANFMHDRRIERNNSDINVYANFLREEMTSYDHKKLSNEDAREVREALKYLSSKEELIQDRLFDATMPKLIETELLLFKLKSGDLYRDKSNTSM